MNKEELIACVIDGCYQVHVNLVPGYLEAVYHNALLWELQLRGLKVTSEVPFTVIYKGHVVGEYRADIIVEDAVVIEVKAVSNLTVQHELQLVNYLACSGIDDGVLVNFGNERFQAKRKYRRLAKD